MRYLQLNFVGQVGLLIALTIMTNYVSAKPSPRNSNFCNEALTSLNSEMLIDAEDKVEIRRKNNSYYSSSKAFAQQWGQKFADMVFNQIPAGHRAKIVIAMGGAEMLEVLLRTAAEQRHIKGVTFVELYLTTKILDPWTALEKNGDRRQSGIGPVPDDLYRPNERNTRSPSRTDQRTVSYISQSGVFDNADEVIVADTGFNGTVVDAVKYAAGQQNFSAPIIGALVAQNQDVRNTVPILSLNNAIWSDGKFGPFWWAHFMDEGLASNDDFDWDRSRFSRAGFERSRPRPAKKKSQSPTGKLIEEPQLVLDQNGKWSVELPIHNNEKSILNYKATILGIRDGME
jgi:hypothetical protein